MRSSARRTQNPCPLPLSIRGGCHYLSGRRITFQERLFPYPKGKNTVLLKNKTKKPQTKNTANPGPGSVSFPSRDPGAGAEEVGTGQRGWRELLLETDPSEGPRTAALTPGVRLPCVPRGRQISSCFKIWLRRFLKQPIDRNPCRASRKDCGQPGPAGP